MREKRKQIKIKIWLLVPKQKISIYHEQCRYRYRFICRDIIIIIIIVLLSSGHTKIYKSEYKSNQEGDDLQWLIVP